MDTPDVPMSLSTEHAWICAHEKVRVRRRKGKEAPNPSVVEVSALVIANNLVMNSDDCLDQLCAAHTIDPPKCFPF